MIKKSWYHPEYSNRPNETYSIVDYNFAFQLYHLSENEKAGNVEATT